MSTKEEFEKTDYQSWCEYNAIDIPEGNFWETFSVDKNKNYWAFNSYICAKNKYQAYIELKDKRIAELEARVKELEEAFPSILEELQACQAVIHLAGGFDPAYVKGAQAAMKRIDALLSTTTPSKSLQRALLEARLDEIGEPQDEKDIDRLKERRAQLAALKGE